MRGERVRLLDIQEAIERIEKYARQGQEAFEQEELIQTWIVHHLQIIGEAARASDLKNQHPEMPWSKIIRSCVTSWSRLFRDRCRRRVGSRRAQPAGLEAPD